MARKLTDDEYRRLYNKLRYSDLLRCRLTHEVKNAREGRNAVRAIAAQWCNTRIPSIPDRDALLADLCEHWDLSIDEHPDDDGADWRRDVRYLADREPVTGRTGMSIWFEESSKCDLGIWRTALEVAPCTIGVTLTNDFTTTKETTMNTITIETRTFINGRDAKSFSDAEVYSLISQQEAKIAELSAITNKPQRLLDEVARRQAGIDALVQYLDDKDTPAA